jgi:hypothetical protein
MRIILGLVLLVLLNLGICNAQIPNLVGNWTGFENEFAATDGSYKLLENLSVSYAISEQYGRLFKGNVTYMVNGTWVTEAFAGAIGPDNKTLYKAEIFKGYGIGTVISDNEFEMIPLEDGKSGHAIIAKVHRIK